MLTKGVRAEETQHLGGAGRHHLPGGGRLARAPGRRHRRGRRRPLRSGGRGAAQPRGPAPGRGAPDRRRRRAVRPPAGRRAPPDGRGRALAPAHRPPRRRHRARHRGGDARGRSPRAERRRVLTGRTAIDLLSLSHHSRNPLDVYAAPTCVGAYVFDQATGQVEPLLARETILATGGLGRIYLHTTNPAGACGDGVAMAYRAGARCLNMQFVQFHPTTLYHSGERFLLSEALRGEGARLVDAGGREFMVDYHPDGSLAPRDIVARGIHQMMHETGAPCAYLDISHRPSDWVRQRFPHDCGQVPRGRLRPRRPSRSRSCRRPTTAAAASRWTAWGGRACAGCAPSARCRARACTARTGWRARRCSNASCGARARARTRARCCRQDGDYYFPDDRAVAVRDRGRGPGARRAGLADHPPDDVELRGAGAEPAPARSGARDHPRAAARDREVLRARRS